MSFNALSNNITLNASPFSSLKLPEITPAYQKDTYPGVLEKLIFKSISDGVNQTSHFSLRNRRTIAVNSRKKSKEERKCLNVLRKIKNSQEITQGSLNLNCNFSNKDSEVSKSAKETYDNIRTDFSNSEEQLRLKGLNRFLSLNNLVFNSQHPISSDLLNKYLAVLNEVEKLFWKPQPVREPEKSKIREIIDEYFEYKLVEKCNVGERESIHSAWKQCTVDIFSAFSSLYHTEECTAFAINYVNNLRDLLGIVPQEKKESIGNTLWSHLQGFANLISEPNKNAQKALKKQLQDQNLTQASDLINQANSFIQQDESITPREDLASPQNVTTERATSPFTDQTLLDNVSADTTQATSTMGAVSSVLNKITDVVTSIFTTSMSQTYVTEELSSTTQASTNQTVDVSTISSTQSATSPFTDQTLSDEVFADTTQATSTMGAVSSALTQSINSTEAASTEENLNTVATQPTEDVTIVPSDQVPITKISIAASGGIFSAVIAFIGLYVFRKRKLESHNSRASQFMDSSV